MQEPGFWDDADTAAKVSADHASVRDRLTEFRGLSEEVADIRGLAELAQDQWRRLTTADALRGLVRAGRERLDRGGDA